MNVVRNQFRSCFRRTFATATGSYVPPSQLDDVRSSFPREHRDNEGSDGPQSRPAPPSPSFYTTRAKYYDQVAQLERAISMSGHALRRVQLLPLPRFARDSLNEVQPVWKNKDEMTTTFHTKMTLTRYRKITNLLNELNEYYSIAKTAGVLDISQKIYSVISVFESSKKDAVLARGKRKKITLDQYGRSYTVGKRKTSSARVWMIPVQLKAEESQPGPIPVTTILVNNIPLNEYFPQPSDREKITRPLKVGGILGKYNIFALARGGGTTGQSGALCQAISKAVVAHEPDLEAPFKKAKLTRRDPRMVERKKTGFAKARKRYTWVKR
ncbi:SSU ribosomal protein S9P [Coprinopsis marcescibilis]|uniref:SSU ribosomal protein S9P n=1 Tax=Coprinopsis marcescibilis TaxID=230819 RepID=A0A5C3KXY3_COPMA|nr:SSU ribosomal protein S9P [Coprinopsis marcescibilis]